MSNEFAMRPNPVQCFTGGDVGNMLGRFAAGASSMAAAMQSVASTEELPFNAQILNIMGSPRAAIVQALNRATNNSKRCSSTADVFGDDADWDLSPDGFGDRLDNALAQGLRPTSIPFQHTFIAPVWRRGDDEREHSLYRNKHSTFMWRGHVKLVLRNVRPVGGTVTGRLHGDHGGSHQTELNHQYTGTDTRQHSFGANANLGTGAGDNAAGSHILNGGGGVNYGYTNTQERQNQWQNNRQIAESNGAQQNMGTSLQQFTADLVAEIEFTLQAPRGIDTHNAQMEILHPFEPYVARGLWARAGSMTFAVPMSLAGLAENGGD